MCVIIVCKSGRPDLATIEKCNLANPDGIGIASRHEGKIAWYKGLDPEHAFTISEMLPFPYVMHFRLASAGSGNDKTLNHPFPITKSAFPSRFGTASRVLFHNGHIPDWENRLFQFLNAKGKRFPGAWSDTRLASLMAHYHGDSCLAGLFPGQKFVIFDAKVLRLIGPWSKVMENGMVFSNMFWKNPPVVATTVYDKRWTPVHPAARSYSGYSRQTGMTYEKENRGYLSETFNDKEFQDAMESLRGEV